MNTIDERVAQYHDERIARFFKRAGLILGTLLCGIGVKELHLRYVHYQAKNSATLLASQHTQQAHLWNTAQKTSKKIKMLTSELNLLQAPPFTKLLSTLTETLPESTLFHELSYTAEEELSITGSSASPHELASYMLTLARKDMHTVITSSTPTAQGILFTLTMSFKKEKTLAAKRRKKVS